MFTSLLSGDTVIKLVGVVHFGHRSLDKRYMIVLMWNNKVLFTSHTHTKAERGNQRNKTQEVHMENSMAGAGERDGSGVERTSHSRRGDLSSVPSK